MKTKKSQSEWTSVQVSKTFMDAAMRRAEKDSGMPEGSIKARGLINSILAKYASYNLIEINGNKSLSETPIFIERKK